MTLLQQYILTGLLITLGWEVPKLGYMVSAFLSGEPYCLQPILGSNTCSFPPPVNATYQTTGLASESPTWWLILHHCVALYLVFTVGLALLWEKTPQIKVLHPLFCGIVILNCTHFLGKPVLSAISIIGLTVILLNRCYQYFRVSFRAQLCYFDLLLGPTWVSSISAIWELLTHYSVWTSLQEAVTPRHAIQLGLITGVAIHWIGTSVLSYLLLQKKPDSRREV